MTRSTLRARTLALWGVNTALAALVLVVLLQGTRVRMLLATPPRAIPPPAFPAARPMDLNHLPQLQEHALLYASRHSYVPPANADAPPRPAYRLVGTFVIPGKPAVALLSGGGSASRKVTLGDTLDGWAVESIAAGRVRLRYEKETFDLAAGGQTASGLTALTVAPSSTMRVADAAPPAGIRYLGNSPAAAPTGATRSLSVAPAGIRSASKASKTPKFQEPELTPRLYQAPK